MSSEKTRAPIKKKRPPLIVHELPSAPVFLGRKMELDELRTFALGTGGAISLVGMGGAGKTAILRRFLDENLAASAFDGVLVWSFYDDPDTNAFLRTAVEYVLGTSPTEASGTGWFHALKQAIDGAGRFLFVLDGLERVQRAMTNAQGIYGELEDALLRGFLVRIASGFGGSLAIITSRFPVSDLDKRLGRGYVVVDVDQLDEATAFHILKSHGVKDEDTWLTSLSGVFGRHALTTDLLGATISRFFKGSAEITLGSLDTKSIDQTEEARLAAVLNILQEKLTQEEVDLLSRLCVFRFGVTLESLNQVFLREGSSAGSLADAGDRQLQKWVQSLVDIHLVHREEGGKLTVHPAVRDHFYRMFRDASAIHGAISEHLLSLSTRPGIGLPTAKESLDLLEELVYHALKAGRTSEALEIFKIRMGGNEHLNGILGEYARTYRVLSAFEHCPDSGAMYHSLRAFGDFNEALKWRPQNKYILIAHGKLEELRDDPSEATRGAVRFLMGESERIPARMADFPISAAHLHLLANTVDGAEAAAHHEIQVAIYRDDLIRGELALGEVARRRRRLDAASAQLSESGQWALRSGSHEHLYFLFLYRARLELDRGEFNEARNTLDEAAQIVDESNFHLFEVEIGIEYARLELARKNPAEAARYAEGASKRAVEFRFVYGEIGARRLQAEAASQLNDRSQTMEYLGRLLVLQKTVSDPTLGSTQQTIRRLESA